MIRPINFKMASHPMNWITLLLMVIIAGAIGHYVLSLLGVEPNLGSTDKQMTNGQVPYSQVAQSLASS